MTPLAGHHFIPESTRDVKAKEGERGEKGRSDSIPQERMIRE
jgi:hypothetical protein